MTIFKKIDTLLASMLMLSISMLWFPLIGSIKAHQILIALLIICGGLSQNFYPLVSLFVRALNINALFCGLYFRFQFRLLHKGIGSHLILLNFQVSFWVAVLQSI